MEKECLYPTKPGRYEGIKLQWVEIGDKISWRWSQFDVCTDEECYETIREPNDEYRTINICPNGEKLYEIILLNYFELK